jgi:hypothetical protein
LGEPNITVCPINFNQIILFLTDTHLLKKSKESVSIEDLEAMGKQLAPNTLESKNEGGRSLSFLIHYKYIIVKPSLRESNKFL